MLSLRSVGRMLKLHSIQSQSGEVHQFTIMSRNSADCNMKSTTTVAQYPHSQIYKSTLRFYVPSAKNSRHFNKQWELRFIPLHQLHYSQKSSHMTMSINLNSRNLNYKPIYKPISLAQQIYALPNDSIDVCQTIIAIAKQINKTTIIQTTTIVVQGNSVVTAKDADTSKMSAINSFGRGRKQMMKKVVMIMGIMVEMGEEMEEEEEMREMATKKANM